MNGARLTPLGARVHAMQQANAEQIAEPVIVSTTTTAEPEPKTIAIFNVGRGFTMAPPTEAGKPAPKVVKVYNKFARRVLRARGTEGRIDRKLRESRMQLRAARRVTDNMHQARDLRQAQREYVAAQKKEVQP